MGYTFNVKTIGKKIKARRKELKIKTTNNDLPNTPQGIADILGIKEAAYHKIEQGLRPEMTVKALSTICNTLDCDIDYLLDCQPLPRKVESDIHSETGLSEEACKIIECKNAPAYYPDDFKKLYRYQHLSFQRKFLSWFIEHGLIDILYEAADSIEYENPYYSGLSYIPDYFYDMLANSYNYALKISRNVSERKREYRNEIAVNLINMRPIKINVIRENLQKSTNNYRGVSEEEPPLTIRFNDLGDHVKTIAFQKEIGEEERAIIAEVAEVLSELSFDYYQAKYETQLNMQIAVNKFNDLLISYRQMFETAVKPEQSQRKSKKRTEGEQRENNS